MEAFAQKGSLFRRRGAKDRELVAAQTGQRLVRAHLLSESCGQRLQEDVSRIVPERVVDLFEVVDVEEHDRNGALLSCRSEDRLLDAVAEDDPVRQPRKLVVQRAALDLGHLAM